MGSSPNGTRSATIVVVTYNSAKVIEKCLKSLELSGTSTSSVMIVDNNSSDETVSIVRGQYPNVQILANKRNYGFAKACNQAIRATISTYVCFLNPDVFVKSNWLPPLIQVLARDRRVAAVIPQLYWPDGSKDPVGAVLKYPPPVIPPLLSEGNEDIEAGLVGFACALFRREIIEAYPLDEKMFLYNEDIDFSLRVRANGYKLVVCPRSRAVHVGGHSKASRRLHLKSEAYFNRTIIKCAPVRLALKGLLSDVIGIGVGVKNRDPWYTYQKGYGLLWALTHLPIAERVMTLGTSRPGHGPLPLEESRLFSQRR